MRGAGQSGHLESQLLQSLHALYLVLLVAIPAVGDVPVAIDNVGERNRAPPHGLEFPAGLVGGGRRVKDGWVFRTVLVEKLDRYVLGVGAVEADDDQALFREVLVKLLEAPYLLAAGGSPGPPFVEPDDVAAVFGQLDSTPVQGRQVEIGSGRPGLQKTLFDWRHAPLLPALGRSPFEQVK